MSKPPKNKNRTSDHTDIAKIETGVAGLDEILHGGLPQGRSTMLVGGPGCGKSVLGFHLLHAAAKADRPSMLLQFEERADAVRANAATFGWDFRALEKQRKLVLIQPELDAAAIRSGDFNVNGLLAIMEGQIKSLGIQQIVIDAIDVLLRIFDDPRREHDELQTLHNWLLARGLTTILTVKIGADITDSQYAFLDYMTDCVIRLDQRVVNQVSTRRLRVIKCRGTAFARNEHPFAITNKGIRIVPVTSSSLAQSALGEPVSSGHPEIDAILGGGFRRGATVLIAGSSGTGKTTLASAFTHAKCVDGEKVLYLSFEESQRALIECMRSPGIDLQTMVDAGLLKYQTMMPEALGVEEHLVHAIEAIEEFDPQYLVVDTISACSRMGSDNIAFDYTVRLLKICRDHGITVLLINQTAGVIQEEEISGVGLSSVVDTVVFLRYSRIGGSMDRLMLVLKSRGMRHSNQFREFLITDHGFEFADVYIGEGGMLTGIARQVQEAIDARELRTRESQTELKQTEVAQQRALLNAETTRLQASLSRAEAELAALHSELEIINKERELRGRLRRKIGTNNISNDESHAT